MGRRQAREGALRMLYSWDIRHANSYLERSTFETELLLEEDDRDFMAALVEQIINNIDAYDAIIAACLKGWKLGRLPVIDRNILRIALAELSAEEPTPRRVVVNEAVELAKLYAASDAHKYIHGVIGNLMPKNES